MSILKVFRSHLGSSQFVFGGDPDKKVDPVRGKIGHFIQRAGEAGSEYVTGVEAEIKELMAEITGGHPHIHVPANVADQTIDTEADPLSEIKNKIRAEERAKLIAEMQQTPSTGETTSANKPVLQGIANTATLNSNSPDNAPQVTAVPPAIPGVTQVPAIGSGADVKISIADKLAALKAANVTQVPAATDTAVATDNSPSSSAPTA